MKSNNNFFRETPQGLCPKKTISQLLNVNTDNTLNNRITLKKSR